MIHGELVEEGEFKSTEEENAEINVIENGGFLWPKIGWKVESVPGFDKRLEAEYMEQCIPEPLRARVSNGVTGYELLYSACEFREPDGEDQRLLATDEYFHLYIRDQGFVDLNAFAQYMGGFHAWQDELVLHQQEKQESQDAVTVGDGDGGVGNGGRVQLDTGIPTHLPMD